MDNTTKTITADELINKVASIVADLEDSLPQTMESVAVTANEDLGEITKESNMEETLKEQACGTAPKAEEAPELEAVAATEKAEEPKAEEEKEPKAEEKEEKAEDKKPEGEEKKKEIKESDFKKAEEALKAVLEREKAEAAGGEDEAEDIKKLKEAMDALGMKAPEAEAPVAPEAPVADVPAPEAPVVEESVEEIAPFASLVASLDKKATVGDSVWMIKNAADNSDYLSFNIKAAFGENIDNDKARSAYATSEEFGKAVVAALINEKVKSATGARAAVLGVVAHYTPSYPGVNEYPDQEAANPGKSGTKVPAEDDKNIPAVKEAKAEEAAALTVTAAEGTEAGACVEKDTYLPGADKRTVKENKKPEESATPHATEQIPSDTDRKLVASYEETIRKQADEIQALKLEAAIKEKAAKVKEAVNLMARAGMIKANEQVRIAALKDGLSVEAANAKAMAASIDTQSKNLFGMNTPQLDAYIKSLAELSPRVQTVQASSMSPLNVKASAMETEEERLSKILGWD